MCTGFQRYELCGDGFRRLAKELEAQRAPLSGTGSRA